MEIKYFPGDIPNTEDWILYQSATDSAYKKAMVKDLSGSPSPQIILQASRPQNPTLGQLWLDSFFELWRFSGNNWEGQWTNVSLSFNSKSTNNYSTNYGGLSNNYLYEFSILEFRARGTSASPFNLKITDLFGNEILEPYPLYLNDGIIEEGIKLSLGEYSEDFNSLELLSFNLSSEENSSIEAILSFSYRKVLA
jgi:hypothetical protein